MKSQLALFFSYAPADDVWRRKLEKHLRLLKREGLIVGWHQRAILAGQQVAPAIDAHFTTARLILLLVSPDFLASEYCWGAEMQRAMERHETGEAVVIPIIVRPADWRTAIFARLEALPTGGKPITSALWDSPDEALLNVAQGIRTTVEVLRAKPLPLTSSQLWTIPYPRNPYFTGREAVLKSVHDTLQAGQLTALAQAQSISGPGGIGKTQTAVEYAYRYRNEYRAVLWAKVDTPETLHVDLLTIATLLNLPEQDAQDQTLVLAAVKRWLGEQRDWLLILDNADDLSLVSELLPPVHTGHVLVTTRAHAMGSMARRVELETMERVEGAQLVLHRANLLAAGAPATAASTTDRTLAEALVQELGGLPLALEQAGAYIAETHCSLAHYLSLYLTRRARLLKRRGGLVGDHPQAVATTWSLSFERVARANPLVSDLLRFCTFLYPEDIPEEFLTQNAAQLGPVLQAIGTEPLALDAAIAALLNYSLVKRTPEKGTLSMHRLVQAVLKDEMGSATQRLWAERAVLAVSRSFPPSEVETWPACQRYLPHALVCADHIAQWNLVTTEAASLLFGAGDYLEDRGHHEQAESLLQRALTMREHVLGPEHPDTLSTINHLALLYLRQSKYEQAESLLQRALTMREHVLGPEHPDTLSTVNHLALLYWQQGKYEQAAPLYQRSLLTSERVLGPEHPSTLSTVNNLALLYWRQDKYEQAESLLQRALTIRERMLGPEHPDTVSTVNNLALLYWQQGKYERAESFLQRALTMRERVLGPERPDTLDTVHHLAVLYRQQGKYEQAEWLYQRVLLTSEDALGPEHPSILSTLNHLALLYADQGKYEQAESLYQRALTTRERVLGPEHPDTLSTLNHLALLYRQQGKYEQAESLYQRALTTRERVLGPEHPDTLSTVHNLALLYADQGKYEQAESFLQRALTTRERVLGPEHPDTVRTGMNYAHLLQQMKMRAQATDSQQ